jgi:hypothetical protein
LEEKYRFMKGPIAVIPILELGNILHTLEGNEKFKVILEKISRNTELDLARLAAFYVKQGLEVVIEPKVQVDNRTKEPDILVTFGDTPVYFEAYCPAASVKYRSLFSNANLIAKEVVDGISDGVNFQIYLLRELEESEVNSLIKACLALPIDTNKEIHYSFGNLAKIMVIPRSETDTIDDGRYLVDDIRRFLIIFSRIRGGKIKSSCLVGMPFTDKRVNRILRKQYPQLSKNECNVVVIELTGETGQIDLWAEGLKARFNGNIYRRIGAAILVQNYHDMKDNKIKQVQRIIRHPNPMKVLPNSFYEITSTMHTSY